MIDGHSRHLFFLSEPLSIAPRNLSSAFPVCCPTALAVFSGFELLRSVRNRSPFSTIAGMGIIIREVTHLLVQPIGLLPSIRDGWGFPILWDQLLGSGPVPTYSSSPSPFASFPSAFRWPDFMASPLLLWVLCPQTRLTQVTSTHSFNRTITKISYYIF